MKLQVIRDGNGKDTGVFIPIEDWTLIKNNYPDIEQIDAGIPQWEKEIIDNRLDAITQNPKRLRPINELLEELNRTI